MLEVREAMPAEYGEAGALTARAYVEGGFAPADDPYTERLRDVASRAEHATVLVALLDGALAGCASFVLGGTPYADQAREGEAEIRMLATAPEVRGRGAGTALVEDCVRRAREAGCSAVRLSTQPTMLPAQRLYERLGFRRTPEHDWSPVEGLVLMTYELPLAFCGRCGEPGQHAACERLLAFEPPRFCRQCRRRMVVQVHPTGWSARCSEHGVLTST